MNYYERHLGDYAKDAGHLSMLEHGAYTLLLDRIYTTEQGIPADQAHRICRARSKEEREAVEVVLAEFFTLADGAWTNGRAEREIGSFLEAAPERESKKENARERQRRTRERRKQLFDALRGHGVVPEYDASTTELQALLSRSTSRPVTPPVTPPVTRDATATQTPDPRHQTPIQETPEDYHHPAGGRVQADADVVGDSQPTPAGAVCKALRQAGVADVNPGHPRLLALLQAGATELEFTGFAAAAIAKSAGFAWVLGAVEGERTRAAAGAAGLHRGPMPTKPVTVPSTDRQAEAFHAAMDERAATATKPPAAILAMAGRIGR